MKKQFEVFCSKTHFLRDQFWRSPMFWNVYFERAITLNFWFMAADYCSCYFMLSWLLISIAFAKIYSYMYAPIFIFFLSVRTNFPPCVLVWMSHHQKYWYFFCDMNNLNQFSNADIYHHTNIMNTICINITVTADNF